jgi:hypothetical protein
LGKSSNPDLFGVQTNWDDIIEERVRLLGTQRREREDREREAVLRARLEAELQAVRNLNDINSFILFTHDSFFCRKLHKKSTQLKV